jgi:hypothetical protein
MTRRTPPAELMVARTEEVPVARLRAARSLAERPGRSDLV